MHILKCGNLLGMATAIQYCADGVHQSGLKGGNLTDNERHELMARVIGWRTTLGNDLQVASTRDQLQRIDEALQDGSAFPYLRAWSLLQELNGRFMDDIGRCQILYLGASDAARFMSPQLFGASVYEAFPSAIDDTEEAGSCLALGRGTACVFHLMRVMEAGLMAVATKMGIAYAPSWESYLKQIKGELDKEWKKKSRTWRKDEPFFADVHSHLSAVKVACPRWRVLRAYRGAFSCRRA